MRIFTLAIAGAAAALLTGCGPADGVRSGDGPAQPGIYAYTMPDGTVGSLVLHDNGDYAQMADNLPRPIEEGTWRRREGQFCLDDGDGQDACFAEEAMGEDGFSLTPPGGRPVVFNLRASAG